VGNYTLVLPLVQPCDQGEPSSALRLGASSMADLTDEMDRMIKDDPQLQALEADSRRIIAFGPDVKGNGSFKPEEGADHG